MAPACCQKCGNIHDDPLQDRIDRALNFDVHGYISLDEAWLRHDLQCSLHATSRHEAAAYAMQVTKRLTKVFEELDTLRAATETWRQAKAHEVRPTDADVALGTVLDRIRR